MRRVILQRWLHVARAALLLVALVALATALVWAWSPATIDRLGASLRQRHVQPFQDRLQEATELLESDRERGTGLLATLVAELEHAKSGDRLGEIKRQALEALTGGFADDPARALQPSTHLVEFAPRDVLARLRHGQLLCARPERRIEGLNYLRELHALLPADTRVVVALAHAEIAAGESGACVATLLRHRRAVRSDLWKVQWGPLVGGDVLTYGACTPLRQGDVFALEFEIEQGLSEFRIHLPAFAALELHDPELTFRAGELEQKVRLRDLSPRLSGLTWQGDTLLSDGALLPWIGVRLPFGTAPVLVWGRLQARISERLPRQVAALIADETVRRSLEELAESGEEDAKGLLATARYDRLRGGAELFWRRGGESFSGERKVGVALVGRESEGAFRFELRFEVGAEAVSLRLDFPEGAGAEYRLSSIELHTPEGPLAIDPATVSEELLHSMGRDRDRFTVSGEDPYFAFPLPRQVEILQVRVVGGMR